ncbi:T9SS type B sorting domain-containing protein [Flavobacterium sp. 17A]|uniref:T9SS type B sorting domain-containing protein n=1 Tax=Flavobacterium potami TaxID=2872310 RepID=A0A9X1KQQ8_9FLAO|nr:T9SS type B sorting domain-containing protein [Flavobacterium potami]MBZ4035740.1 T9SS type B sorting domain-containing protein [Flavobacterium potami]
MKKPTTLRTLIFALALLFNFVSQAQNGIAFNSKLTPSSNGNLFLDASNQLENPFSLNAGESKDKDAKVAALTNPVIPYAQLPYAGQVTQCPNDGKLLPKLFLCGGNDSRLINTQITDAQSIIWERFISGGTCVTVSNSDCANEGAASTCWNQVGTGKDYLANSAGQFRVRIVDAAGNPYIFYFNVYQNTLIPTATTKSDIIRNSAGNCQVNGRISVGGFGAGYEYSFTRTGTSGAWQDSNIFTTSTPGNYTAFIRIKGVVGSCEFKVINLEIKNVTFAVTTSIASPKCSGATGSVQVITNDINQEYTYTIYNGTNTGGSYLNRVGPTLDPITSFNGLSSGTYTVLTSIKGSTCDPEKNTITIAGAPNPITSGASLTTALGVCSSGQITITRNGGTAPYKYFVNTNGAGFTENPTNIIVVTQPGSYIIRVEDANGCSAANNVTVNVPAVTKPIYQINKVDGDCLGNIGKISLSVTNNNTYNLIEYSIDNGANFSPSTTVFDIPNEGSYRVIVRYRKNINGNGSFCTEPATIVTVGPSVALTASAGVGELSGCGPVGKELYGLVRIINPQGGTPFPEPFPYKYSFDGKKTWTDKNSEYMNYGQSHTVYIKDAAGCEYAMGGITIDKKPDPPTIKVLDPVFNCDGSATTTVTVTNSGSGDPKYAYDYYMDGVLNTSIPTNVFRNVTQGDHTVTVKYNVLKVSTYSNLLQEDFGKGGFTTTPGINPAYCYEDEAFTHLLPGYACNRDEWINDGEYAVASKIRTRFNNSWIVAKDHTTPTDALGRFLVVNVGGTAGIGGILYSKPIKDVIENQDVIISLWAENLIVKTSTTHDDPKLTIQLVNNLNGVGGTETIVATTDTSNPWVVPKSEKWEYKELMLNPGAYKNLSFVIRSYSNQFNGNDVLIDDIWVRQIPKSCNTVADFPIYVDGSKAFSAGITGFKNIQCSGEQNGEITLSAKNFDPVKGFQYFVAGDPAGWRTYIPVPAASSGSITLTNLQAGTYNIQIRYDNSANSCTFPLAQEIKMPKELKVRAWVDQVLTCDFGATIKAEASDGTPGYEYELRESDGVTVVKPFQQSGEFLDIKKIGNYKVIARDLNSCQTAVLASVDVVAPVPAQIEFQTSNLCFNNSAEIIVKINGGVGKYTYTTQFNGGNESEESAPFDGPTFTYTATDPGSYTFKIKDSFGCFSNTITQIINEKLTVEVPVTRALSCDVAPDNRAIITGTISGGKGPFVVAIASGDTTGTLVQPTITGNTFTYSTTVAGDYTFRVTDSGSCSVTSVKATILPLNAIILTSENVNPKCNTSNDGTILLKPSGGSGDFKYSTDGITYNDKSYFTGLSAGVEYTYYVIDSNKCTQTLKVTLIAPDAINGTATITTPYTCDNPATITVGAVVTGGNGVYKYTLNRDGVALVTQDSKVFSGITTAGSYTVTITDSNSCTFTTTPALTIEALNGPKAMTINKSALTCPTNKSTFSITDVRDALGAPLAGPFTYSITAPASAVTSNTTGTFANLNPGVTYTFEVKDAKNCSFSKTDKIDALPVFSISSSVVSDVNCLGDSKGEVTFTVSGLGNNVDYTYQIDGTLPVQKGTSPNTGTSFTISAPNLNAGLHTIIVTNDVTKCSQSDDETISAPTAVLALDPTGTVDVTCKAKGSATINAKGGWGTYSYEVTPTLPAGTPIKQSIKTFSNLSAGDYSFVVTDLKGCQVTGTFTIKPEVYPAANIDVTSDYCAGGAGATLIATPTNAPQPNPNYEYRIDEGNYQASGTFPGLNPGKHIITVRDILTGCTTDLAEETIAVPLSAKLDPLVKDLDCDATNPNAIIKVVISNGYPDYTYRVSTNGGGFSGTPIAVGAGLNTFNYTTTTGSAAATYQFEIFDNKGCRTTVTQNINARVSPTADTTPNNPTCYNGTDGSIEVTPSLGLAPYTYEVSTISGTTGFSSMTSNKLTGVGAGTYWFRVTDAKKCQVVVSRALTNPAQLTAHADVTTPLKCGANNATQAATITVTIDNPGTPYTGANKYRYSYNGATPVTSNTYTTTTTGTVTVDVYDANNCPFRVLISPDVKALVPPTNMTFDAPAAITCASGRDKTDLTVRVDDGVAPFRFEITNTDAAVAPTAPIATGVTAQDHTFADLAPGTYYFKVTDANDCATTGNFKIDNVLPVTVNGSVTSNVNCKGAADGKLSFTVSGNSGTFTYVLRNAANAIIPISQSTQTGNVIDYTGLAAGIYTITITNPTTQCTATKALEVKEAAVQFAFSAPTITPITCSPNNGKVVINTVGGWGNNRYTLTLPDNTVVGPQASATFSNLTQSGTYGISVTDLNGNGCTITTTFNVAAAIQPDASIDLTLSDLCYDAVGKATIVVTPAVVSPTYMYNINDGMYQASGTFNNLNPGSYVVKVKDMSTGCILTLPAQAIETELKFEAKLETLATCNGQDVEIKGTISGGKTPYTYTVTINGTLDPTVRSVTGTTFIYTDPTATTATGSTTYLFTLSDASTTHCSLTSTVVVAPKTNPDFSLTPNSTILCNGDSTGSITVTIDQTKGASPYTINVTKDNSTLIPATANVNYGTQTTGLPAGNYIVRVTDAKGCYLDKSTIIREPAKIEFMTPTVPLTCDGTGLTYGSISVKDFTGGSSDTAPLGPFTYTLTNNVGEPTQVAPHSISDVRGDYTFNILNFGIYELTVSDKNGCSVTKTITMSSPPTDLIIDVTSGAASCTDASVIVSVNPAFTGGPYHFALYPIVPGVGAPIPHSYPLNPTAYQDADSSDSTNPLYLQSTFTGLNPGVVYSFIVYDETTRCYYFKQAESPTKTASVLTSTIKAANVTCQGAGNGNVSFTIANTQPTTTQVKYEIFNSQTNKLVMPLVGGTVTLPTMSVNNVGPLVPGTYYILFTEQDGLGATVCLNSSKTFTITQSVVPLTLTTTSKNDNCGPLKGIVEAFGQGGTTSIPDPTPTDPNHTISVPYLYQIFADTGAVGVIDGTDHSNDPIVEPSFPATFDLNGQTKNTFNLDDGNYIVYVKDANGCIQYSFINVGLDTVPVITAVTNDICVTEGSFVIDVNLTTTGVGQHYYILDGGAPIPLPSTSFSITNLSSGAHSVEVKDVNGCGNKVDLDLISTPLELKASFSKNPICENNDGEITAEVTGGFTPNNFQYTLVKNSAPAIPNVTQINDPKFVGLTAGNYTITVRDLNTTCTRSVDVDMILPTPINFVVTDIVTTPVDCTAGQVGATDNGTLTVNLNPANDNPDYTYVLTPVLPAGLAKTQLNNNVFTGLSAGDYTIKVISGRGCELELPANVPAPAAVVASADATPFSCAVDPTITTVVVTGLGGTGTYTFSKDGTNYFTSNSTPPDNKYTFEIEDNLAIQNPTYWVKDSNGCLDTSTLTTPLAPLPKLISATATRSTVAGSQIDCVNGRELIQIDVVGGSSTPIDLKYEVSIDGNAYTILAASSGSRTYNYDATSAGSTYQFRITDNATGCEILSNIYDVPLFDAINVTATTVADVQCKSATNGNIEIFVSGYTGPYTYALYDGVTPVVGIGASGSHDTSTSNPFTIPFGLGAGTNYTVRIVETAYPRCTTTSTVAIINEPTIALSLDPLDVTPLGCTTDGAVKITTQGGWGNNVFTLSPPSGAAITNTTGNFAGLRLDGLYGVSVRDANGCTITDSFNLVIPTPPTAVIASTSDYCYDSTDLATLVVTASGGAGGYEYSIDKKQSWTTNNTFTNLTPGIYDIIVKDAYGCEVTVSSNEIKPQLFATAQNDKNIFCTGTVDGTIKITAQGGYGSYTYTVNKDNAGAYAPIAFPAGLDTAYYTVPALTGAGSYEIVVYDLRNCSYTVVNKVVMVDPTPVDLLTSDIAITPVDCNAPQGTNNNGTITVNLRPVNNNPIYTYTLTPTLPAGAAITQVNNNLFTGLTPGQYNVSVTSERNCEANVNVAIADPVVVTASATATAFSCAVDPTKTTAVVTAGGGTGTYSFSRDGINYFASNSVPADNRYTFELSDTGATQNPTFYVKDSNSCVQTTQLATVLDPLPKFISVVGTFGPDIDCVNNKQEINVVITGGSNSPNAFTYNVYQDGALIAGPTTVTGNTFTYDAVTVGSTYEFEVLDNNTGCSIKSAAYEVPVFNIAKVNAVASANVDCNGNHTGAIEINVIDYNGPYNYAVYDGANPVALTSGAGDSATANPFVIPFGFAEGKNYRVVVTETAYPSCTITSNDVEITEPPVLSLAGFNPTIKNQNCINKTAVITIDPTTIVGGSGDFKYAVVPTTTPPTIPAIGDYKAFTTIEIATAKIAPAFDSYDVYVKDANECFAFVTVNIAQDPMPAITSVVPTHCPSATGYEITVTANGFTSNLEYSLDKNTWQLNNNVLVVTSPGDYKVYVRDENLCIVEAPVTILTPLQLRYDLTTSPICNGNQGVVTLLPSGGTVTPSYEFSQNGNPFVTSPVFSNLVPGNYQFTVRDTGTGCTKTIDVTIDIPNTAIDFTLESAPVICSGGSTGTITVKMAASTATVNNNPVYTYSINPAPLGMVLVGNVFTNLPQGSYTVTVTSGKGCPVDKTIVVTEPPVITVSDVVVADYGCTAGNKENNATITVNTPTGGSGNYSVYEFFRNGNPVAVQRGDNPVFTESDLLGGNYVINVYDDKGCVGTTTARINPFIAIDFANPAVTVTKAITCINKEDIQVNVTFTGGPAVPLQYTIVAATTNAIAYPSITNANGQFIDLTVGTYTISVTNPVTGCVLKTIHYVDEPNTFDIVAQNIKNVSCFGTATGNVDLTFVDNKVDPTDDAGIFDYTITGPVNLSGRSLGTVVNIPNLTVGIYHVTATLVGTPTCQVETDFTIDQPVSTLQIAEIHTPITCDPGNDGTISASAQGGWTNGDYLYELVGPVNVAYSTQSYFENLTAGDYTINVKDVNGCIATTTVTLKNPDPIMFTAHATVADLSCNGDATGEITVDPPTGGQESNYYYILNYLSSDPLISTDAQSSPVFSGLPAGRYSVTVIDEINCSSQPSAEIEITEPSKVKASLTLATRVTCKVDATVTLSAEGGNGPYDYSLDQTFNTIAGSFGTSITFSVGLGDHQYYVRDSNGCIGIISNNINIAPITPLSLEIDLSGAEVYCKGSSTAVIDAVAGGGLGNYSYTLLDASGNQLRPAQPEGYFDLLPTGVYIVRVDSDDCQYDSETITIDEPNEALLAIPTVTDATCFGANDGKIAIAATGGTGVIKYAISPNLGQFDDKFVFDRLSPGKYTIIVQDENSCFVIIEREIQEPNVLEGKIVGPIIQEICDGDNDGAFTIEVSGGRLPYSISLDNENGTYVALNNGTRHDFTNIKGGTHNVYIKDASCTTMVEVNMDKAVILNPTAEVTYDCVNNAQANMVVVTIDASNTNPADVDYSLDNSGVFQPSNIFTNVAPGTHFIIARHTNDCKKQTATFTIDAVAEVGLVDVTDASKDINVLQVKAFGGIAPYEYSFNGEAFSSSNTYRIYKTGDYPVTVRDKNGCEATIIVHGIFYDFCMPNYFTPNGSGSNTTIGPDCGALAYKELTFDIYDRYGRVVAKYHVGQKWDGKYNGNELPTGDYWYVLKLNDPKDPREFVGHFTLYR